MQTNDTIDKNNIKILPPSENTMRLVEESEQRFKEMEAAGWTKERQAKMDEPNRHPPGYLESQKHMHGMANMADTALINLEKAAPGRVIDINQKPERV